MTSRSRGRTGVPPVTAFAFAFAFTFMFVCTWAVPASANDAGPAAVAGVGPASTLAEEQIKHAKRMSRIAELDALVKSENRQDLAPRVARMAKKEVARHTRALLRLRAVEAKK